MTPTWNDSARGWPDRRPGLLVAPGAQAARDAVEEAAAELVAPGAQAAGDAVEEAAAELVAFEDAPLHAEAPEPPPDGVGQGGYPCALRS